MNGFYQAFAAGCYGIFVREIKQKLKSVIGVHVFEPIVTEYALV